jgi:hypothetical protein
LSSAEGVLVDLILDLEAEMMTVVMMIIMIMIMMFVMTMIIVMVMVLMIRVMMMRVMTVMMMTLMTLMMAIIKSDLFGSICYIHRSIGYGPTHLPSHPLQRRKEYTVDQCWLQVSQSRSYIPGHTEVCILVYGTGDEARHLVVVAKGYTEGGREGRTCLDSWE